MNNCILAATIVDNPELRYTSDSQMAVTSMVVEFEGQKETTSKLKVVAWGGLADQVKAEYQVGDRVIIDGRLRINTLDRPEGFKETRAELTVSKIFKMDGSLSSTSVTPMASTPRQAAPTPTNVVPMESFQSPTPTPISTNTANDIEPDLDNIPF
jgi:single-stranded DNA-binding protein